MKPALSLLILLTVAGLVDVLRLRFADAEHAEQIASAMGVGLLMIGAYLAGGLFERIKLPAITGYLILGILVGPFALNLITSAQTDRHLVFVNDLAIALIALTAGGEIRFAELHGKIKPLSLLLVIHMASLFVAVLLAVWLCHPLVPFLAELPAPQVWVVAALAAVVMVAKSPAVTVAMISDYRASGPLSRTTLVITVIKDLTLIVLFAVVVAMCRGILATDGGPSGAIVFAIAVQMIGSILIGCVFGFALSWYLKRTDEHLGIIIIGFCLLVALIGEQHFTIAGAPTHLEPLLMALAAGLLMRNAFAARSEWLFSTVERMSLPIYCLFFALAGARFDLHVFANLWWVAAALVAVRLAATWGGMRVGLAAAGMHERWGRLLWLGMISQAGVSLVLVTVIRQKFGYAWAAPLGDVLVGAILLNQLVGPIGFRHALLSSGEARQRGVRPMTERLQRVTEGWQGQSSGA